MMVTMIMIVMIMLIIVIMMASIRNCLAIPLFDALFV